MADAPDRGAASSGETISDRITRIRPPCRSAEARGARRVDAVPMIRVSRAALALIAISFFALPLRAQIPVQTQAPADTLVDTLRATPATHALLWLIDDRPLMLARIAELRGSTPFPMLRSTSSLLGTLPHDGVYPFAPQLQLVTN